MDVVTICNFTNDRMIDYWIAYWSSDFNVEADDDDDNDDYDYDDDDDDD